jgi:ubiquitin carboxyl-terminal hydrolase 5/13
MCNHLKDLELPSESTLIYKEECTLCYDSQDSKDGIFVCLVCYNGSCFGLNHTNLHFKKTNHTVYLNIKRRKILVSLLLIQNDFAIKELVIMENTDEYEYDTTIICLACNQSDIKNEKVFIPYLVASNYKGCNDPGFC